MRINRLSTLDTITAGDLLVFFSSSNSDDRKATVGALTEYLEGALNLDDKKDSFTTQRSAPNITAFSVTVNDGGTASDNAWLIITPDSTFADLTIVLPLEVNAVDKQEIIVNCSQIVTTLTIDVNGATSVTGAPTTLSANDTFKLKYDKPFKKWYAIG